MTGLVLCAFFAMGMMMGLSAAGRAVTIRTAAALGSFKDIAAQTLAPVRQSASRCGGRLAQWAGRIGLRNPKTLFSSEASRNPDERYTRAATVPPKQSDPIAIVERRDGFYALDSMGGLSGPMSPGAPVKGADLPILSGAALDDARAGAGPGREGRRLADYAAIALRAETQLSKLVSEMRIGDDGTAVLFLERSRTAVGIDIDRAPIELESAARLLRQWNGREVEIASLDMTVPDEAIVRLHPAREQARAQRAAALR